MIKNYESKVKLILSDWVNQLRSREGQVLDITHWIHIFAFDVMGDIGFSQHWGVVKDGGVPPALHLLTASLGPMGRLGRVGWIGKFLVSLAYQLGVESQFAKFVEWSRIVLKARRVSI